MLLITPPGVYRAQADTELLLAALEEEPLPPGAEVLDVGTGSGALAVAAARRGAAVTAVDVSWGALAAVRLNGALHGRRIRARHGDLLGPVSGRRFDLVLSNPPYVPSRDLHPVGRGPARAWDAGPDGRRLVDRICLRAGSVLRPGGVLLLVHSDLCGVDRTCALLREQGLGPAVVSRLTQPFGPVMRSRAEWFEQEGLIPAGRREEELVVIRGVRPR